MAKIKVPWAEKMANNKRSVVKKNTKKPKVRGQRKMGKKVCGHRKMVKHQSSTVREIWHKIKGPWSEQNGTKSKVHGQNEMAKNQWSTVREKWQKINGPTAKQNG